MVVFPTVGFASPLSSDRVIVTVDYLDKDGDDQVQTWDLAMNHNNFKHATDNSYLTFKANERTYLGFTLNVTQDNPINDPDPEDVPDDAIQHEGYYYTYNVLNPSITADAVYNADPFVTYDKLPSACPVEWSTVTAGMFAAWERNPLRLALEPARGSYRHRSGDVRGATLLYLYEQFEKIQYFDTNGSKVTDALISESYYRPICRRAID